MVVQDSKESSLSPKCGSSVNNTWDVLTWAMGEVYCHMLLHKTHI